MQIDIHCENPVELKALILEAVKDGTLETWKTKTRDNEKYLTHSSGQYVEKVYLHIKPNNENDKLEVIPGWKKDEPKPEEGVMEIYLGMFTSALLTHFKDHFEKLETYV